MPITDPSGNTLSAAVSELFNLDENLQMYNALIKPIRDADAAAGGLFVKRFLNRPQTWFDVTAENISALSQTDSPATCRADLLQYLKDHVGLTVELKSITDRLDTINLRKFIALAIPLWKRKGTAEGMFTAVRVLTGRNPGYLSWFDVRTLVNEAMIGEDGAGYDLWLTGSEVSYYDEYVSHMRVMDDGTLDEQLLLDLVGLFRPSGERIEIALLDFLDRFDLQRDRWSQKGAVAAFIDSTTQDFVLPPNSEEETIVPGVVYASLLNYTFKMKFKTGATGDAIYIKWYQDAGGANTCFRLTFTTGGTNYYLDKIVAGVVTTLASGVFPSHTGPFVANCYYMLRVETAPSGSGSRINVFIDENNIILDQITTSGVPAGPVRVAAPNSNTGNARADGVEIFRNPLRTALVSINGSVTYTSNFID